MKPDSLTTLSAPEAPLWSPSAEQIAAAPMTRLMAFCGERFGHDFSGVDAFHDWSVSERGPFWEAVWDFCGVIGEKGETVLVDEGHMTEARFFPDARLNFAENLLRGQGEGDALLFRGEDKAEARWSHDDLRAEVSRLQQAMAALGIGVGDRVAAMMPNLPETLALMLAAASLGAVWSSCSPDFGEQGVLDRFGQIGPKLFIACDGYWYNGKRQDVADKVVAIAAKLGCPVLIVPYAGETPALVARLADGRSLEDFAAPFAPAPLSFTRLPFAHPLYILFSSGTTGVHHMRLDDVELAGLRARLWGRALPL